MIALFKDREHAGVELANKIVEDLKITNMPLFTTNDLIVVAIPRGGIILADIIAKKLSSKIDVLISRKIRSEFNDEFAIGAVMPNGEYFVNNGYVELFQVSQEYLEKEIKFQRKEINRRLILFRGKISYEREFDEKVIILVDDGIATGATIIASARWIKNNFKCKFLIVAVPVAPANDRTITILSEIADTLLNFIQK
ncbi:phosphoribosyltransferase [Candidatus Nitrosocosmicus hydrocola]|uniref:phosphoribosyltransferase n=1 Tax=Candidatus Nitrosocosmicus hydrocola TaxID=1826872 RepID=UPI0011E59C95|nr:phosphoribosyltransferase family protein [Candidatus Nitrosocosmicus hydrocola]